MLARYSFPCFDEWDGSTLNNECGDQFEYPNDNENKSCDDKDDDRIEVKLTLSVGFVLCVILEVDGGEIILQALFFYFF